MELPPGAQAHGPALLSLLGHLSGARATPPTQSFSARLAQWIEWREAVALSAALEARPGPPPGDDRPVPGDDGECERVRTALAGAIEGDRAFAAAATTGTAATGTAPADVAFYRERYIALQQRMDADIRHLRGRLRSRLARQTAALARLAAMDAVMERALAARERALLAALPEVMAGHFERLRQDAEPTPDTASTAKSPRRPPPTPWLDQFRRDMQRLLLAELDVRMQPTRGLLSALRTASGHHGQ